jgi:SAM-dependent methyltransferase
MAKYTHNSGFHNLLAPSEIVPVIIDLIKPNSVIDIGCGTGTFLKIFKDNGVQEILGIDGPWCDQKLLLENINISEFHEREMESSLDINQKYDLAVCLEVAEHLSPERADSFVKELTTISNIILFSAAIPRQGGDHHFNEQWLTYWKQLFEKYDFEIHDVLRSKFWDNPNIYWWYKQNMVLIIKKGHSVESVEKMQHNQISNIVHPDLFLLVNDYRDKNAIKRQLKLLFKTIRYKLGLIN